MSKTLAASIMDIAATVAPLEAYLFLAKTASRTITGYFVDQYNQQVGVAFTATVTTGTAQTLATLSGAALDANAVGVVLTLSGDTYIGLGGGQSALVTDLQNNPTKYPYASTSTMYLIGRVNS